MFDKTRMKTELHNYKQNGISKSLVTHRHTNELTDEDFDEQKYENLLDIFVNNTRINELVATTGLHKMVREVKDMRKSQNLPQPVVDAVLVDFINYVANSYNVDYNLYVKDIR